MSADKIAVTSSFLKTHPQSVNEESSSSLSTKVTEEQQNYEADFLIPKYQKRSETHQTVIRQHRRQPEKVHEKAKVTKTIWPIQGAGEGLNTKVKSHNRTLTRDYT